MSKAAGVTSAQVKALKNTLQAASETEEIGGSTLTEMAKQRKKLANIHADAQDIGALANRNKGVVKDLRRNFFMRLCCYNRNDVVFDYPFSPLP